jgi:signal transduction histidine kinase
LISGISVFSVNVNTRIKTENLLRESSKRFKTAIDNFPYEFIILNPDFRILYMNKLGLKRINAAFHDIVGHSLNDADWNEIASQCQSIQNEVIREKRTIHRNIETGSPENLQIYKITYVPVLNDNKEIREIFRILIDITQISQNESRLRALSNQLEKMREEERHRISRDIHDDLGQILTALKIDLVSLQKKSGANHEFHDEFGPIIGLVDAAIDSARRVSFELRPGILDQTGLIPAVEWLINQSKKHSRMEFQISLPETGILEIDTEKSVAIYRILQEILTNISRHADATKVNISLRADGKTVKLLVSDNGKGFDFDSHAESLGILGIKERARMQNGTLVVQSQPMEGTFISLTIPYS